MEYEADPKHREVMIKEFGLQEGSKALVSPGVKGEKEDEEAQELDRNEARWFRSVAARGNYLGADRGDIQYAVKEASRGMAKPTWADVGRLKRVARYLVGAERIVWRFRGGGAVADRLDVYVDSDWAGRRTDRKSTSGGVMCVGGQVVKTWSSTQGSVAMSSGEAEYYALVKGAAEGLGLQAVMADLGWKMDVKVWSDSSAARGMAARRGLGKNRHMEVKYLWIQEVLRSGRLEMGRVPGWRNGADMMTKYLGAAQIRDIVGAIGGFMEGRLVEVEEGGGKVGGEFVGWLKVGGRGGGR